MKNTLYMIGNTHFDPVWLWTWDDAMSSIRATFRSALDRMKEDPNYIYSFCTPPVFEWIRKTDPAMFEEIKSRVAEGRWDLAEGFWLQPDCNAPHGESFVRHGLYTQNYLQDTFGKRATTVFNIDSFGHAATLPQIMKKCGLDYYVFGRPDSGEKELEDTLFMWQSPDGSEVMAMRAGCYQGMYYMITPESMKAMCDILPDMPHGYAFVFGVSNHGGAPTRKCIAEINELIDAGYDIKYGSTADFFKANEGKLMPVIADELQVTFIGPYSNDAQIKSNNRLAEYAAIRAEIASVFAGVAYLSGAITFAWKDILFNQFHDILGGACIKNAYHDARNLHGRALQNLNEITHTAIQYITKDIAMPGVGLDNTEWNAVILNLSGVDYKGVVEAEVQWVWEHDWYEGDIELVDGSGKIYPCQMIRELSVITAFRSRIAFYAEIPAFGYKTFAVRRKNTPKPEIDFNASLENKFYKLTIGEKISVYDKVRDCELLSDAFAMTVRQDEGDTWGFNIKSYGVKSGELTFAESSIIESGSVFTTLKVKSYYNESIIEQYFTLYEDSSVIDYKYRVNWNEKHKVLKLGFDFSGGAKLTAAVPYGSIERGFDGKECPVGEWLDVSAADKGFSLLMRNNFAYDTTENHIGVTVLRSPVHGDLRRKPLDEKADYDYLNQGITEGSLRLVPHGGDYVAARIPELASAFNNPPVVVIEANHGGSLSPDGQFLKVEAKTTMVGVLKKAENGADIIIRLIEYGGKQDNVKIYGENVVMKKYEIKTLKVNASTLAVSEVNMLEEKV